MRKRIKKISLIKKIFIYLIASVTFLMLIIALLHGYRSINSYNLEVRKIRRDSQNYYRQLIKFQVQKVVFYIEEMIKYNQNLPPEQQNTDAELQNYLLNELKDLRFGNDDYFFGSGFNGKPLFSNGKITRGTRNLWELTDPNGIKIIQRQQEAFFVPEGVFVEYHWNKLNQDKLTRKLSYTMAVPKWNWIIGTGVYMDDIEHKILEEKIKLRRQFLKRVLEYALLLLIYIILSYFVIKHFARNIKNSIDSLSQSFNRAARNYEYIDLQDMRYPEFAKIANSANIMIEKRRSVEEELKITINKYTNLINTTSEGFWMIDKDSITTEVNAALCSMLGYSASELLGKSPAFFMDEQNKKIFSDLNHDNPCAKHFSFEIELSHKNGKKIPCFVKTTRLFDNKGDLSAHFAFITDITQRKEYEKKLKSYRDKLEDEVKERTRDLEEKNKELERFNKLFIGRELRIKELRDKIQKLEDNLNNI